METRDSQRQKVYDWERTLPGWSDSPMLSLEECSRLAERAAKRWGLPGPKVSDGRRRRNAAGGSGGLWLPRWSRSPLVVLHETAHYTISRLDPYLAREEVAAHGREFAWVLTDLFAIELKQPVGEIRRSARAARIKVGGGCTKDFEEAARRGRKRRAEWKRKAPVEARGKIKFQVMEGLRAGLTRKAVRELVDETYREYKERLT